MSSVILGRLRTGIGSTAVTAALASMLPQLDRFVDEVVADLASGRVDEYDEFARRCRNFFTDETIARVDEVIPGWAEMASYQDGVTLWHTTAAMASLRQLDEYRDADPAMRNLMDWAVLLHDLAKQPGGEGRDHCHAFRSAAAAARVLPGVGFEVTAAWSAHAAEWYTHVASACRFDPEDAEYVQDNRELATILGGADQLFAADGAIVLKAIALHLSVTVVADWPARTPLTRAEEQRFVDAALTPVLLATMLADHGGWNTFDEVTLARYLAETRAVFGRF